MRWSYSRYFAQTTFSVEDDHTVKFESLEPFADILAVFCEFWPSRVDENNKPVLGTGPYQVVEFDREGGVGRAELRRLSRGEGNAPHIIIATSEPSAAERLQLLQSGEVDAAINLERAEDLSLINFDRSLRWVFHPSPVTIQFQ